MAIVSLNGDVTASSGTLPTLSPQSVNLNLTTPLSTPAFDGVNVNLSQQFVLVAAPPLTPFSGTSTGQSTADGNISVAKNFSGTVTGQSAASGDFSITNTFSGTSTGQSTADGNINVAKELSGTSTGQSTADGNINVAKELSGTSTGQSTADGNISVAKNFSGTVTGQSTADGNFTAINTFSGTVTGQSNVPDVTLITEPQFAGTVTGQSTADGNISVAKEFSGTADGQSTTNSPLLQALISGTVTGQSTADGSISIENTFSGTVTGQSTADGSISIENTFSGTVTGQSTADGNISVAKEFSGTADGQSTTNSPLLQALISGTVTGQSTTNSPPLQALISGTVTGQSTTNSPPLLLLMSGTVVGISNIPNTTLVLLIMFSGTVTGQSSVPSAFLRTGFLQVDATSSVPDANINLTKQFNGTVISTTTVSGDIQVIRAFDGTVTGQSSVPSAFLRTGFLQVDATSFTPAADIVVTKIFAGIVTGQSDLPDATVLIGISGTVTGQSTTNGNISVATPVNGTVTGLSSIPVAPLRALVSTRTSSFTGRVHGNSDIVIVVDSTLRLVHFAGSIRSNSFVAVAIPQSPTLVGDIHSNSDAVLVANSATLNFAGFTHGNTSAAAILSDSTTRGQSSTTAIIVVAKTFASSVQGQSSVPSADFIGVSLFGTVNGTTRVPALLPLVGDVHNNSDGSLVRTSTPLINFAGGAHGNSDAQLVVNDSFINFAGNAHSNSDAHLVITNTLLTNFAGSSRGNSFAAIARQQGPALVIDPGFTVSTSTGVSMVPAVVVVVAKELAGDVTGTTTSSATMLTLILTFIGTVTGQSRTRENPVLVGDVRNNSDASLVSSTATLIRFAGSVRGNSFVAVAIPNVNIKVTKTFSGTVTGLSATSSPPLPTIQLIGSLSAGSITLVATIEVEQNKTGTVTAVSAAVGNPFREREDLAGAVTGVSVTGVPFSIPLGTVLIGNSRSNSDAVLVVSGFAGVSHGNTSIGGTLLGGSSVSIAVAKALLQRRTLNFAGFTHGNSSVGVAIPSSPTLVGFSHGNSDAVLVVNITPVVVSQSTIPPAEFDLLVFFTGTSTATTQVVIIDYDINVIATGNSQTFVYRKYRDEPDWQQVQVTPVGTMTGSFRKIAHNGTYYLLVSDSGFVFKSDDPEGNTWTNTAQLGNEYTTGLEYSPELGYWMVTFRDGRVYKSPDGVTWTYTPTPHGKKIFGLTYGQNLFVAVGENGLLSRYNGVTWTVRTIEPKPQGPPALTSSVHGNSSALLVVTSVPLVVFAGTSHGNSSAAIVVVSTPFDTPYFGIKFANDTWITTGFNYIIRSTDAFDTYERVHSIETNTLNAFGTISVGCFDTWLITGDEVVRYSLDGGITWFESFVRFRANRDAVFDGQRWFVVDSTLSQGGQGRIIQNGTIQNNFGMPDENSDFPLFVTLTDPYIAEVCNLSILIEYPPNDFTPFRKFELTKGVHWEEIGEAGKFSRLIRILSPPHLISPRPSILALNVLTKQIQILQDWTEAFIPGFKFRIVNSGTGNDGVYTTVSSSYFLASNRTTVTVVESFVSATIAGQLGDDNQLLNKHAYASILSFFTWEPSVLTDFEMYNIATNNPPGICLPCGALLPIPIITTGLAAQLVIATSTVINGPSFEFVVGDGICPFPGNTVETPLQVFAFVTCEAFPDVCNNIFVFPPNPCP